MSKVHTIYVHQRRPRIHGYICIYRFLPQIYHSITNHYSHACIASFAPERFLFEYLKLFFLLAVCALHCAALVTAD